MNSLQDLSEFADFSPEVITNRHGEEIAVRFDVNSLLEGSIGTSWQRDIGDLIMQEGVYTERAAGEHYTVREADPHKKFGLTMLDGEVLVSRIPALWDLHRGSFRWMMQAAIPIGEEPMRVYDHPRRAFEPLSQPVSEDLEDTEHRMEGHVDQRYTALLVIEATHPENEGRLATANNPDAQTVEEIREDATFVTHKAGTLYCVSRGSKYPHYPEKITDPSSKRIIVVNNYPKESETDEEAQALLDLIEGNKQ